MCSLVSLLKGKDRYVGSCTSFSFLNSFFTFFHIPFVICNKVLSKNSFNLFYNGIKDS
jgi:hypothetical protein